MILIETCMPACSLVLSFDIDDGTYRLKAMTKPLPRALSQVGSISVIPTYDYMLCREVGISYESSPSRSQLRRIVRGSPSANSYFAVYNAV
jgi:hypothetical protein